ncbi:hypothetical protein BJ138DRAFT_1141383 [Hygrophoropsis aurantiaca]|uniref:Uncharacterized protein n=1 Tax=Hygrophoropsis aurantiaca TaxID=72124 RepID=A0ACB8AQQ2_9AGAM|nr:hypothetical protein BJ138DRAFT_1141383 [Hygrophoropsis aurantiaca]
MSFVNSYQAPPDIVTDEELYGPDPYDLNFVYPVPTELAAPTAGVKLVPFVPRVHGEAFLEGVRGKESMFRLMPLVLEGPGDFLRFVESFMRRGKNHVLFSIIDTTRPDPAHPEFGGSIAGVTGLANTSPDALVTEIGPVIVLPAFQRTHVGSHSTGLILQWAFGLRTASPPGLGMRRVMWATGELNKGSSGLATRMGFKYEGLIRWACGLPYVEGFPKEGGLPLREGDPMPTVQGRHSLLFAQCWDDWENGGKGLVECAFVRR